MTGQPNTVDLKQKTRNSHFLLCKINQIISTFSTFSTIFQKKFVERIYNLKHSNIDHRNQMPESSLNAEGNLMITRSIAIEIMLNFGLRDLMNLQTVSELRG